MLDPQSQIAAPEQNTKMWWANVFAAYRNNELLNLHSENAVLLATALMNVDRKSPLCVTELEEIQMAHADRGYLTWQDADRRAELSKGDYQEANRLYRLAL
jgi:hypothetical protein